MTTGASNDFMQVSRVARQMVERFGFSKKIGQVAIGGPGGNPFLGQQVKCVILTTIFSIQVCVLLGKKCFRCSRLPEAFTTYKVTMTTFHVIDA